VTDYAVATTAIVAARVTILFSLAFTSPNVLFSSAGGLDEAKRGAEALQRVVMTDLVWPCTRISAQSDGEAPWWRLLRHCAPRPKWRRSAEREELV
jgi:hypothetical protein